MPMLLQVSLETFYLNLLLIIAGVFCALAAFVLFIASWMALNALIWLLRRRRAERVYRARTFRADGERYPAFMEGVCRQCGRGGRRIYYPQDSDKELCPDCYERHWRRRKGGVLPNRTV